MYSPYLGFSSCSGPPSPVFKIHFGSLPNSLSSIGKDVFNGCSSLIYNEFDNALYLGNNENPYLLLVKAKDTLIKSWTINGNCKFIYTDAFSYCYDIYSANFEGTIEQWNKIFKGEQWNYYSSLFTIYCSDGTVYL